jgi:prevent-host-death family protein
MERIGIRELRQHASTWVAKVQAGATIEITSHGRLVARLVPLGAAATREALIDAGRLIPAPLPRRRFDRRQLVNAASLTTTLHEPRVDG